MLPSSRTPGAMISFSEQTSTILEFVLVFVGLGFLVWLFLSSAGRALRASPAVLPAWEVSPTEILSLAWIVLASGFVGQVLLSLVIGHSIRDRPEGEILERIIYGSTFQLGALLAWLYAHLRERHRRRDRVKTTSPWPRAALGPSLRGAALTFLAVIPLVSGASVLWEIVLRAVHLSTERQELVDYFTQARSPLLLGLMIALALLVAPVSEELVFRAGIFRYLRTRVPRWIAFTASAGLFALLHANWSSFLPLFVLGLVFAFAYERTGRMAVPMLAHALFNLNTLLLVLSHAPI
jgi:membrane protease YdiL (CAAX protease family)